MTGKEEIIKQIGDQIGYGELMTIASRLWQQKLIDSGLPNGEGAFIAVCPYQLRKVEYNKRRIENKCAGCGGAMKFGYCDNGCDD